MANLINNLCVQKISLWCEDRESKTIALKIYPDDSKPHIQILPSLTKDELQGDEFSLINNDAVDHDASDEELCFWFTEMVLDMWLKLGATKFMLLYNIASKKISLYFNKGLDDMESKVYWKTHKVDGYILEGDFFKREWRKDKRTHGGKIE
jgi:hypothetical protein